MPKFTDDEIKADIDKLQPAGFKCAVYYLKAELKRRKGSQMNRGRPPKDDNPKRAAWREAAKRYREKKKE